MSKEIKNAETFLKKISFGLQKHSSTIFKVVGVAGVIGGIASAIIATRKAEPIFESVKEDVETIKKSNEAEDSKKNVIGVYAKASLKLVKYYAPTFIFGSASIVCIFANDHVLKERCAALSAAYAVVSRTFKEYRERVVERYGDEVDRELRFNVTKNKIKETVIDPKTGEEKKVKKEVCTPNINEYSDYARIFEPGNPGWDDNPEYNMMYLKAEQQYLNDMLRARGHLFLNEVYDELGFKRSKAGQIVGWVYDPDNNADGDNYVDFGLYDKRNADFVNGYEHNVILDFNVDGPIQDLL